MILLPSLITTTTIGFVVPPTTKVLLLSFLPSDASSFYCSCRGMIAAGEVRGR